MSGALAAFLIAAAERARLVAPRARPKLLEELIDQAAQNHRDPQLRGVLTHGREMVLKMAAKATAYPQPRNVHRGPQC